METTWYQTYTTTTMLLFMIHIIFIHQVIVKRPRKSTLVSFQILVIKKQYYRALPSLLSHPPTRASSSQNHSTTMNRESSSFGRIRNLVRHIRNWYLSSVFSPGRILSGLPLMFYNAFVLWNCRALEPLVGSYSYARSVFHCVQYGSQIVLSHSL